MHGSSMGMHVAVNPYILRFSTQKIIFVSVSTNFDTSIAVFLSLLFRNVLDVLQAKRGN